MNRVYFLACRTYEKPEVLSDSEPNSDLNEERTKEDTYSSHGNEEIRFLATCFE